MPAPRGSMVDCGRAKPVVPFRLCSLRKSSYDRPSLSALQFFYLRRVRNKTELTAVLKTLKSDTAKKAFLQLQLKIWYRGLRLVDPKPFSNGKDKTIGGVIELTTRLEAIVGARHQIPTRPPIETKDPEALQSLGVAIAQRQELMKEYKQQAVELQVKQEDLIKLYTPGA